MTNRLLALDASTKTGWALFVDGQYVQSGALPQVKVVNFNVNTDPELSPEYPYNVVDAAAAVAAAVEGLLSEHRPTFVVVENTNRGRNRHTQRILEFLHLELLKMLRARQLPMAYMDSSDWRKLVEMRLSPADKINNRQVSAGKKRGRIKSKHLAVRLANERFGLALKLKDNDQADACLLGLAYCLSNSTTQENHE
jgi:hypothetical protein